VLVDGSRQGAGVVLELEVDERLAVGDTIELELGSRAHRATVRSILSEADALGHPYYRVGLQLEAAGEDLLQAIETVKRAKT
jgi:hypothetical protein